MYRKGFSFLTAILFIFLTLSASTAQALEIKVGLAVQTPHLQIGSGSSITAVDGNGRKVSGSRFSIKPSGSGNITVGNRTMPHPVKLYSKSPLVFNNRKYRGYFMILNSSAGLTLVNVVNMEDYLRGVLKMEVNPDWPTESLKAQSIISRTYAMKSRGRHGSQGFDVCDKSHCQVYRGINAEDPVLDSVIKSTNGIILKYGNSIASTFFHSDSGGATADVSTVWSSKIPYLKGSEEPFKYKSPYSDWKVSLSRNEVDRAIRSLDIILESYQSEST